MSSKYHCQFISKLIESLDSKELQPLLKHYACVTVIVWRSVPRYLPAIVQPLSSKGFSASK
ncbi:MAG: hypothetical protein F6K16_33285 [Symploca sp. SIO2B6]|nr:hypothetical protein [Symploca sp. SIO2B6]